jgi:prepilin-type N-terminal cleavage/methylation domain-containing protein
MNALKDYIADHRTYRSSWHRAAMICYHREMRTGKQSGFTLLEILVTLAVVGLLMAGLVQGLRVGVSTWTKQMRGLTERGDLDSADRTLRALIARMDPGGVSGRPPILKGTARSMEFTTTLPETDALVTQEADVALAVDAAHQLELLWLPHARRRGGPVPSPERVVLLRDVLQLDVSYWQNSQDGWQAEWRGTSPPKLIRLRLVFSPRSGQHAPDIVVAPMRDRWRL